MNNELIEPLCNRIFSNEKFHDDYEHLVKKEFSHDGIKNTLSEIQVRRLIETASIFSLSPEINFQKLALKIAVFLLNQTKQQFNGLSYAIEIILSRLGDIPTISHMINEKDGMDYFSYFSESDEFNSIFLTFPEILETKIFNKFDLSPQKSLNLTTLQSEIIYSLIHNNSISFSAPTSAGKSFIIHNYIAHKIYHSNAFTAVYLVPTKSLVAEVQKNILKILKDLDMDATEIAVVNSAERLESSMYEQSQKKVLILTQERLQYVLARDKQIQIDLLVVDEAQKVKEEERGVILEDVIGQILDSNTSLQCVFISPFIKNPSKFWKIFDTKEHVKNISSSKTPVGQNVFYVNLQKSEATISLMSEELNRKMIEIERIPLVGNTPNAKFRIKSMVVNQLLKNEDHTLVYCDRPSECVQIANTIYQDRANFELTKELAEAIDFIKTHVHEEYYLADHLTTGIGYHYGKMPQFVRLVVRELFDNKQIKFLCCTSTLLEGVNLPAKNIVLYKPKAGTQKAMDKFSIKNLAGRAGRLGKDYYGNIFCINIEEWENGSDTFDDELESISSSVERTLTTSIDKLIEHLTEYKTPEYGERNIASVSTSLIIKQLRDPEQRFLSDLKNKYAGISEEKFEIIKNSLQNIARDISPLDKTIMIRNPSIDPRLQFEMFSYLRKGDNLILPPEPYFENFYDDLEKIFGILGRFIFKDKTEKQLKFYSFVANEWILQHSYKSILENRIRFLKRQSNKKLDKPEINRTIDSIDDVLETTLKFEFTRGLRCYCDIAEHILERKQRLDQFSRDLPNYLETGAYDRRVFLLLDLGLSRNSAISLSHELMEGITPNDALLWLKENSEKTKQVLHPLQFKELEQLLNTIQRE